MDFEKCKQAFDDYVSNFDKTEKGINLKYYHSYAVSELMAELAFRLELSNEDLILAKMIGLLHDIGRFEQLKKFHSFDDRNVDHADESCNYLFKDGHIRDFVDDDKYDSIIEKAIRYHNKYALPQDLEERELLFSKMIRDMDKVDIYKQCAVNFSYTFDVEELSEDILKQFEKGISINRLHDLKKSDNILVMLAFIFDMNFNESFDILVEQDNFDLFLSMVEVSENSEKLWKKVREICFDKINRGVGRD